MHVTLLPFFVFKSNDNNLGLEQSYVTGLPLKKFWAYFLLKYISANLWTFVTLLPFTGNVSKVKCPIFATFIWTCPYSHKSTCK